VSVRMESGVGVTAVSVVEKIVEIRSSPHSSPITGQRQSGGNV
jgi:hypothetical protein